MTTIVSVVGTIGTIPKLIQSEAHSAFCTFRLASTPRRYDRESNSWVDGDTSWYTVNAFRSLAEHADASFSRGDRVIVSGRLRVRPWKTEDRSGTAVEIEADALGHDLRWGTTRFRADSPVEPAEGPSPQPDSSPEAAPEGPLGFPAPDSGTVPEGFAAQHLEPAERAPDVAVA